MEVDEVITLVKECGLNIEGTKYTECQRAILNALEKQIPKKPNIKKSVKVNAFTLRCPNCGAVLQSDSPCCRYCGQALDWESECNEN